MVGPPFAARNGALSVRDGAFAQALTQLDDHFDYPTAELSDNGWTTHSGTWETASSDLVKRGGEDDRQSHEQPFAYGWFRMHGWQNTESFYGQYFGFIRAKPTGGDGYNLFIVQERHSDVRLVRIYDGFTTLIDIGVNHGGNVHSTDIYRDPTTSEFEIYYDGTLAGTVTDDLVTTSNYWMNQFDNRSDYQQRVDRVVAEGP